MTKGIYAYFDKQMNEIVYVGKDSRIDIHKRHKAHHRPTEYDSQQINRLVQNNPKRYVYGLSGLMELLGCSISTAERIKQSGVIDEAISQTGDIIVTDAELALDLLRVSHKYRKYSKPKQTE